MKIYTKTGDGGQTGLVGGSRVSKGSSRIQAIGDVDELNAAIGCARAEATDFCLDPLLAWTQSALFDVGAELASAPGARISFATLASDACSRLEASIDEQSASLSPLRNFILPGGCKLASSLHFARCVCRRAERSVLLLNEKEEVRSDVLAFLNRLSDWLFVAARTANHLAGVDDVPWRAAETSG